MQEQIYKKDIITIFASNEEKRLKLRVEEEDVSKEKITIYEAVLESLADGDKLSDNFENFQQVVEQIKDNPDGVDVDLKRLAIVINAVVVGKKAKQVTLGVIPLHQKQTIVKQMEEVLLMKVIEVCNSKAELTSDLTKELLQNISVGLKFLLEERKQTKEWRIKTEARMMQLQEENQKFRKSNQSTNSKIQKEATNDKLEPEKQESIQQIQKVLFQKFLQELQIFTKKQEKQLSKVDKLKHIFQIALDVSSDKLKAQVERLEKEVKKLLPLTAQKQDKYLEVLFKYKPGIMKLMEFGTTKITQKLKINIQVDFKFEDIKPIFAQLMSKVFNLLGHNKPSLAQAKQLTIDQTQFIKQSGENLLSKIYYKQANFLKDIETLLQLFSNAVYDHVRSRKVVPFSYYQYTASLMQYQQQFQQQAQKYGENIATILQQIMTKSVSQ